MINPNNPTGAVYQPRRSRDRRPGAPHQLVLLADEIYDKILYDDAVHIPLASVAPDVLTLTFNGLSKAYRVCGYRAGWLVVTGPLEHGEGLSRGHHPAGVDAPVPERAGAERDPGRPRRLPEHQGTGPARRASAASSATGRHELRKIPGVSVVEPRGALYVFPRLDPEVYPIKDDQQFALDLLAARKS